MKPDTDTSTDTSTNTKSKPNTEFRSPLTKRSGAPKNPRPTRDAKGRWLPGVSGNTYRGLASSTRDQYATLTAEHCTLDKWSEIVQTAVEQAIDGDRYAREWLSKQIFGRDGTPVREESRVIGQLDIHNTGDMDRAILRFAAVLGSVASTQHDIIDSDDDIIDG